MGLLGEFSSEYETSRYAPRNHGPVPTSPPVPDDSLHHRSKTTPRPISTHSSFRAFSDEEIQPHSTPAWPDVAFSPASARPRSSSVSINPLSGTETNTTRPHTSTRGRWTAYDRTNPSKLKNGARAKRVQREKSNIPSQLPPTVFSPLRQPFVVSRRPTPSATVPSPGQGCSMEDGFGHDVEMADMDSIADSRPLPVVPEKCVGTTRSGMGNAPTSPQSNLPQSPSNENPSWTSPMGSASNLPIHGGSPLIMLYTLDQPCLPCNYA
jgi:hypothetical protein